MQGTFYKLAGISVVPCDMREWAEWCADVGPARRVAVTELRVLGESIDSDPIRVSTVFLGIDHGFGMSQVPIVFETMVFGGRSDLYQDRCCFWGEALDMHRKAIELVKENYPGQDLYIADDTRSIEHKGLGPPPVSCSACGRTLELEGGAMRCPGCKRRVRP